MPVCVHFYTLLPAAHYQRQLPRYHMTLLIEPHHSLAGHGAGPVTSRRATWEDLVHAAVSLAAAAEPNLRLPISV